MDERRILLVEDEQRIADTLRFGLKEQGFEVEVAYDGNLGYKLFQSLAFNLIVLDINLPGINGYELCKLIRSSNPEIPVIMLTALNSLEEKIEGYDAGADDYIIKPFEFTVRVVSSSKKLKTPINTLWHQKTQIIVE